MRVVKVLFVVAVMVAVTAPATIAGAQESVMVKDGCGKILKVVGNTVVARIDSTGKVRVFKNVGPEVHFMIGGEKSTVYDLREGMHACVSLGNRGAADRHPHRGTPDRNRCRRAGSA